MGNILDFVIFWYNVRHFFLWGDKNNTAIFFLRSGQCFDSFFVNKCWIKIPQASDLSCTVDISEKKLCIHSIYHWIKTGNCLIIFSNHGTMIELCRQTGCTFNSVNLIRTTDLYTNSNKLHWSVFKMKRFIIYFYFLFLFYNIQLSFFLCSDIRILLYKILTSK